MPSQSQIATLDKQIAKAENELTGLDVRRAKAQGVIDNLPLIEEELRERISYLRKVRARKIASGVVDAPVAAADDETPVLNTELETPTPAEVLAEDSDPRLTSAV